VPYVRPNLDDHPALTGQEVHGDGPIGDVPMDDIEGTDETLLGNAFVQETPKQAMLADVGRR